MAWRTWVVTALLVMAGLALVTHASAPVVQKTQLDTQAMRIDLEDDRLTVKLREVPLAAVLSEIGRRAAIEISLPGVRTNTISMEFQGLPLETGLRRLLRGYGWVMVHAGSTSRGGRTLTKVIVLPGEEGIRPAEQESPAERKEETLAGAVATLVGKEEVQAHLRGYLRGSDAKAKRDAFRSLIGAVEVEELDFLITMLRDENVQPTEWEVALGPVFGLMSSEEQAFLRGSLQDRTARQSLVETFESYRRYKAREEAKVR